jgi:hypothetical protein
MQTTDAQERNRRGQRAVDFRAGGTGGVATLGVGLLGHDSCGGNGAVCTLPLGPGGEAVNGTAPGTAWLLLRLRDV